jgi:hypothetical protein
MARKNVKDKSEEGSRDIVPYKKNVGDLRAEFYGIMCLGRQRASRNMYFSFRSSWLPCSLSLLLESLFRARSTK